MPPTLSPARASASLLPRGIKPSEIVTDLGSSNPQDRPDGIVYPDGHILYTTPLFLLFGAFGWIILMAGLIYVLRRRPGSTDTQHLRSRAEKNTKLCGHHGPAPLNRPIVTDDDPSYPYTAAAVFGSLAQRAGDPFSNRSAVPVQPFNLAERWSGPSPLPFEEEAKYEMTPQVTAPLTITKEKSNSALACAAKNARQSGLAEPAHLRTSPVPDPFVDPMPPALPEPSETMGYRGLPPLPPTAYEPHNDDLAMEEDNGMDTQEDAPLVLNASPEKRGKYRYRPPSPERPPAHGRTRAVGPRPRPGALSRPAERMTMQDFAARRSSRSSDRPVRMKSTSTARGADLARTRSGATVASARTHRSHRSLSNAPKRNSALVGPRPRSPVRTAAHIRGNSEPPLQALPTLRRPKEEGTTYNSRWWGSGYAKVGDDEGSENRHSVIATDAATVSSAPATSPVATSLGTRTAHPPSAFPAPEAREHAPTHHTSVHAHTENNPFSHVADLDVDPYAETEPLYDDVLVRSPSSRHKATLHYDYDPYAPATLYPEGSLRRPGSSVAGAVEGEEEQSRKLFRRRSRPDGAGSGYGRRYRHSGEPASWSPHAAAPPLYHEPESA